MDLEEMTNDTVKATDDIPERRPDFYERLFLELFTAVSLASVVANVLIIFVVVKFKKLRRETTNVILAHLSLVEILYLLSTPLTLRVVSMVTRQGYYVHVETICAFYEFEFVLSIGVSLFLILLVCDWYLKTYSEATYVKFCRVYKFFAALIYIWIILLSAVVTPFCYKDSFYLMLPLMITFLTVIGFYALLLIFLIAINIVHVVKKRRLRENKHNMGLFVGNMFFVLWIPITVLMLVIIFARTRVPPELPIVFFALGFTSPIGTLLYLFYYVDSFNVFLKKVFKCQCNEYGNELLEEQTVAYSDENGVKI